jgi:hypothetical protein
VSESNSFPAVGESVTLTVSWSDNDASLTFRHMSVDNGAGVSQPCATEHRFGPWSPPARNGGSSSFSETVSFDTPGDHVVTFNLATGDCNNPYGSEATVRSIISVQEPAPAA